MTTSPPGCPWCPSSHPWWWTGRRGKTVTLVTGVPSADLTALAGELKRLCGSGGAVKDGVVEIQGDHRAKVIAHLEGRYRVTAAGG